MNEQYQLTYCTTCGATHHRDYPHKEVIKQESWLTTVTAGIMCLIIIGLIFAFIIMFAGQGPK
jgi:hypothetical protein